MKASVSNEPRQPAEGVDQTLPPPPPPIRAPSAALATVPAPPRPLVINAAQPRSQEESIYQDSLPPTPRGGIQKDELEGRRLESRSAPARFLRFLAGSRKKQQNVLQPTSLAQHRPYPIDVEREGFPVL